jgi:hypothetical protein
MKREKEFMNQKPPKKKLRMQFRVKTFFATFKPTDNSVQEKVWGYRGEEKPRFASSGFSFPLCSATSGADILKTQVFKKKILNPFKKIQSIALKKKSRKKEISKTPFGKKNFALHSSPWTHQNFQSKNTGRTKSVPLTRGLKRRKLLFRP